MLGGDHGQAPPPPISQGSVGFYPPTRRWLHPLCDIPQPPPPPSPPPPLSGAFGHHNPVGVWDFNRCPPPPPNTQGTETLNSLQQNLHFARVSYLQLKVDKAVLPNGKQRCSFKQNREIVVLLLLFDYTTNPPADCVPEGRNTQRAKRRAHLFHHLHRSKPCHSRDSGNNLAGLPADWWPNFVF